MRKGKHMAKKKARKKAVVRGKSAKSPTAKKPAEKAAKHKQCGKKTACTQKKAAPEKSSAGCAKRHQVGRKIVEMRTWRRIGRLADDALVALDADKVKEARRVIDSIRAVAMSADRA